MQSIVRHGLDDLLNALFDYPKIVRTSQRAYFPSVKIEKIEKDNSWLLRAEVPGYTEEDIKVEVKEGILTISGKQETTEKSDTAFLSSVNEFRESFAISDVKADDISAEMKSGILVVTVPKANPVPAETKQIPIKT